jgi:hypothetical protein
MASGTLITARYVFSTSYNQIIRQMWQCRSTISCYVSEHSTLQRNTEAYSTGITQTPSAVCFVSLLSIFHKERYA